MNIRPFQGGILPIGKNVFSHPLIWAKMCGNIERYVFHVLSQWEYIFLFVGEIMKRIICIVIMCCMVLITLTSCQCKHTWKEATCTSPSICSECGETQGEALGHSFTLATCTSPSTCRKCGITQGTALGHSVRIGLCSNCNLYSYTLRAEATEIDNISTECVDAITNLGEHLKEYLLYSSDTYKRLAVAEAFADFQVTTDALIELAEKSKEHSEFSQIATHSVGALVIVREVLQYCEGDITNHGLFEKMYVAFDKLVPIMKDINTEIEKWNL